MVEADEVEALIDDYICKANNKMAEISTEAADLLEKTGCKCDISSYMESIADINSSLYILNKSFSQIKPTFGYPNYVKATYSEDPIDNIRAIIDRYVIRYNMNDSSVLVFPGYSSFITILPCCDCDGTTIPEGGGPGYFLTKDGSGNLIWRPISSFLKNDIFIYDDANPQDFTLSITPSFIYQVFVRGVFLPSTYWSIVGDVLTIGNGWVIGDGSEVVVFYGFTDLQVVPNGFEVVKDAGQNVQFTSSTSTDLLFDAGNGIEVTFVPAENKIIYRLEKLLGGLLAIEEFVNVGTNDTFTLSDNARAILFVFVQGHKIATQDYTHTTGTDSITLTDALVDGDEVDVAYEID